MKVILLVLLFTLTFSIASATKWHELEEYTFEDYIIEFGKNYEHGSAEYIYRQSIFEFKLADIKKHNKESNRSFKKGVNQFTDQTPEEFSRKKGFSMSVHTQYFQNRMFTSVNYQAPEHAEKMKNMPLSVDWREKGIVSTIKDQGECGSCWAFASTSQLESYTALNTGHLETLSVEQIVSCTPNPNQCGGSGGCNGAIAELAFEYVQSAGITIEWKAPYQSYFGVSPSCSDVLGLKNNESLLIQKNKVSIGGYVKIIPNSYDDLMYHIAYVGPLAISVDASEWNDYEEGVFDGCSDWNNITIDHAVQLVGYGTDAQLGDYFLIRNSWDTTFGEMGYIRIKREANPPCGVDQQPQQGTACVNQTQPVQVCGQCGMLYDSSYPTNATLTGLKKQTKI